MSFSLHDLVCLSPKEIRYGVTGLIIRKDLLKNGKPSGEYKIRILLSSNSPLYSSVQRESKIKISQICGLLSFSRIYRAIINGPKLSNDRLLQLIIDPTQYLEIIEQNLNRRDQFDLDIIDPTLNTSQRQSIKSILFSRLPLHLIQGPPGTGSPFLI